MDPRAAIQTTHAAIWKAVRTHADILVKAGPPIYQSTGDREQLCQRDVGNATPTLAIAYLLSNDHTDLDSGEPWASASWAYRPKMTASHNTLIIDGHGELGEGKQWFDAAAAPAVKSERRVTQAMSTSQLDRIAGDAADRRLGTVRALHKPRDKWRWDTGRNLWLADC